MFLGKSAGSGHTVIYSHFIEELKILQEPDMNMQEFNTPWEPHGVPSTGGRG